MTAIQYLLVNDFWSVVVSQLITIVGDFKPLFISCGLSFDDCKSMFSSWRLSVDDFWSVVVSQLITIVGD